MISGTHFLLGGSNLTLSAPAGPVRRPHVRRRHETMTTVLLFVPHDTQMGLARLARPAAFLCSHTIRVSVQPREFAEGESTLKAKALSLQYKVGQGSCSFSPFIK